MIIIGGAIATIFILVIMMMAIKIVVGSKKVHREIDTKYSYKKEELKTYKEINKINNAIIQTMKGWYDVKVRDMRN